MLINPFPPHLLVDRFHRPYVLTDEDLTLERLRALLVDDDSAVRAYEDTDPGSDRAAW
jgi:hypothetical protein